MASPFTSAREHNGSKRSLRVTFANYSIWFGDLVYHKKKRSNGLILWHFQLTIWLDIKQIFTNHHLALIRLIVVIGQSGTSGSHPWSRVGTLVNRASCSPLPASASAAACLRW